MANANQPSSYVEDLFANPWLMALAISLAVHVSIYGGYKLADEIERWQRENVRLIPALHLAALEDRLGDSQREREIPMMFVDVDPALASQEPPPEETKFYGAADSVAANAIVEIESDQPKIDGSQELIPKAEDTAKSEAEPLQPSPEPEPTPQPEVAETAPPPAEPPVETVAVPLEPETSPAPVNLESVPPAPVPETVIEQPKRERPRTLAEVRKNTVFGERVKQSGGVKRQALIESFDVKGTPFGSYDAEFIAAVQHRWDALMEGRSGNTPGKVVVEFRLSYDGRITDLRVIESEVGNLLTLLCEKAILDPAPYPRWPIDMRRAVRSDSRHIKFTFYYMMNR
jgi:outer membrane biosynthesis protein TonB